MGSYRQVPLALLLGCMMGLLGCAGNQAGEGTGREDMEPGIQTPSTSELQQALSTELAMLGIDPDRVTSSPPSGDNNAVFDLAAQPFDPDGIEGEKPMQIRLSWTERLLGDYDQNGEVLASDLSTLGQNFGIRVEYRLASEANGLTTVPKGEPTDLNWRMARVDGDGNGEIGLADLTVIAQHFGESIDGYRIYKLGPGEFIYHMLPNTLDPQLPYTISRFQSGGGGAQVIRYYFDDLADVPGSYRYYVVPYDIESGEEGKASLTKAGSADPR